ncbi:MULTISPECIES: MFS transporter [unclassified Pseudomonas]|uniref:MFS transporter n=1 Tax=unclassified Pseudomonas TaxID=196821 RepID=UPI0013023C1A|nr:MULTISPECIES: MFS transporter [unclassified Pseudomonas]
MSDNVHVADAAHNSLRKAAVVVAGPALVALIPMAAAPALPDMAQYFSDSGDGALLAQLVMTVPAITVIVAAPLMGYLAERIGRRVTLLVSLLLFALSGSCTASFSDPFWIIAARLLLGVAGGGLLTVSFALAGDFQGNSRERVLGFAGAGAALMAIVAMIAGGYLVDLLGWRGPFTLYLLSIPVLLLGWGITTVRNSSTLSQEKLQLSSLWPLYLLTILFSIGLFMPGIQGPFLLEADGVHSATARGMILSAYSLMAAVAAGCYGSLRRHMAPNYVLILTSLALGGGCIMMALAQSTAGLVLGCVITGIGAGLVEPITVSLVLAKAPVTMRGRAVGLLLSAVFLGQFLNPLAVGPLRSSYDIHGAFYAVGATFIMLAVLVMAVGRRAVAAHEIPTGSNP